jgi:hypothetical protein
MSRCLIMTLKRTRDLAQHVLIKVVAHMANLSRDQDSAKRLRAPAHPLRWKPLDLVSSEGEATATRCSQVLGDSIASCSYHLGILGKYGYLQQVTDTPGREKPWRPRERTQDLSAQSPELEDELASEAAIEAFLDHEFQRIRARQRLRANEPTEWRKASRLGGSSMWVAAEELQAITDALIPLLHRYEERAEDPSQRPPDAREARVPVGVLGAGWPQGRRPLTPMIRRGRVRGSAGSSRPGRNPRITGATRCSSTCGPRELVQHPHRRSSAAHGAARPEERNRDRSGWMMDRWGPRAIRHTTS